MKFKLFNKSQAALEFLTTYGWAFLVIIIMISTLAYFGILNPSKILPDRCNIGSQFECKDYQISASSNTFKIRLKNNVGEPITVQSITLNSESATSYNCPTLTAPSSLPTAWKSGEVIDFAWSGCNSENAGIVVGQKGKVFINIKYFSVSSGSNYAHEANGEVFSTIA